MANERREFQRFRLAKPILALLDGESALILDVGLGGAFIEHRGELVPGRRTRLVFRWQGNDVEFASEVVHSAVIRTTPHTASHSGLRFVEAAPGAKARLQEMMATLVARVLAAQRANAAGELGEQSEGEMILARIGEAHRSRASGFTRYRFNGRAWSTEPAASPQQWDDGFTVSSHEDERELEKLCASYQKADADGRHLIRLVAELSARSVSP